MVQDIPMVYEQEDVAYVLAMKHGLMQKTFIPLNPQVEMDKSEICELVSSITVWYIWKAQYLKVFQNTGERPIEIIYGIRTKIVHNRRGYLDNIKGTMQQGELKRLEFHAIWDKGIFYRWINDKVEWFYSTMQHLFKLTIIT